MQDAKNSIKNSTFCFKMIFIIKETDKHYVESLQI